MVSILFSYMHENISSYSINTIFYFSMVWITQKHVSTVDKTHKDKL